MKFTKKNILKILHAQLDVHLDVADHYQTTAEWYHDMIVKFEKDGKLTKKIKAELGL